MKKRTLCLLLAGVMALSLLGGCGGQPTGGQPNTPNNPPAAGNDNVPNNEAPMVPPDDWEETAQPEDDLPSPRDPRWDELQPGETAAQIGDVFIKSGMTLGEAVEQIENSELFLTMNPQRFNFDEPQKIFFSDMATSLHKCTVRCNGEEVFTFYYPYCPPGEVGDAYNDQDCLICLVRPINQDTDDTWLGAASEIEALREEDVQKLVDTMFVGMDAEVESSKRTSSGVNLVRYTITYKRDCSYDGYVIYGNTHQSQDKWRKGLLYTSSFDFVYETGELYRWSIDDYSDTDNGNLRWRPENMPV